MKYITPLILFFIGCAVTFVTVVFLWTKGDDLTTSTHHYEYHEPGLPNPLMGFAPWATAHLEDIHVPYSMVYVDMTWKEIEPEEGVYNFQAFEDRTHLNEWRAKNIRVVFRFVMDFPREDDHIDIPEWLYVKIDGDGDHYDTSYGKGFSPNYADRILIEAHKKVIAAIADRYDNDDVFSFVELGSLGHWGEWHIKYGEGLSPMPPKLIREIYMGHYTSVFHNAKLLTRRPFSASARNELGLYNDMFGVVPSTATWLDWISDGGDYDQAQEIGELVPMPNAWINSPIGGEISGSISPTELFSTAQGEVVDQIKQAHVTFIGPGGYANPDNDPLVKNGQLALSRTIGYKFFVESAKYPSKIMFGDQIRGTISLSAQGIAPFYFDWPVQIVAVSKVDGSSFNSIFYPGIQNILPGDSLIIPFTIPVDQFAEGDVELYFSILDPLTGKPGINLSNTSAEDPINSTDNLPLGKVLLDRPFLPFQNWMEDQITNFK